VKGEGTRSREDRNYDLCEAYMGRVADEERELEFVAIPVCLSLL
jgi:hypothetical protein